MKGGLHLIMTVKDAEPGNGYKISMWSQTKMFNAEQGLIQDFWKGVHMYKGVGLALLNLSHFSYISHENEIIWSH